MHMTNDEYQSFAERRSPRSPLRTDCLRAFLVGGLICCIGQGVHDLWSLVFTDEVLCSAAVSISMIFLGVLLTGLGVYDDAARFAGAGTLVPITGFANAMSSPAIEFKPEGLVLGVGARMFAIAGPVIVYGVSSSIVYGLMLCIFA